MDLEEGLTDETYRKHRTFLSCRKGSYQQVCELGKNLASLGSLLMLVWSLPSSGFGFLAEGSGPNMREEGWSLKAGRLIRSVMDPSFGVWASLQVAKDRDVGLGL